MGDTATEHAREAVVLELYRLGKMTSGRAAEEMGFERYAFLALASSRRIPTMQITPEEQAEEIGSFKR